MQGQRIILSALAASLALAFVPAGTALDVSSNCDDNTTTFGGTAFENTIMPIAGAAFGVGGSPTPGPVGGNHVGPQSTPAGNTPSVDAPLVPPPAQVTPPRAQTNWTPDCATVAAGGELTWTNGDGEAVHAPELGQAALGGNVGGCWRAPAGLAVPTKDTDQITFGYDETTGNVLLHIVSTRQVAANTASPTDTNTPVNPQVLTSTFSCTPLQLALTTAGAGAAKHIVTPGLSVDSAHRIADLTYTCIVHHGAMTGHVKIKF